MAATPTFVEIVTGDTSNPKERTGLTRFRIADSTLDSTIQTNLSALIATMYGAAKPSLGAFLGARVIIESADAPTAPVSACDIRNLWKVTGEDTSLEPTRFQLPALNPSNALIASGSVVIANLTATAWVNFLAALNTMGWISPKDGTSVTVDQILSTVRARVRPRVGSVR